MLRPFIALLAFCALLFLSGCSSTRYEYRYVRGRTATLSGGYASAPESAPAPQQDRLQ